MGVHLGKNRREFSKKKKEISFIEARGVLMQQKIPEVVEGTRSITRGTKSAEQWYWLENKTEMGYD